MKVFGIGLNKTGTTSLGKALDILGFKDRKKCNLSLTKEWSEKNIAPILQTAEEYNNFVDWPWPLVYKELYATFEDAKFILTIRASPEKWYESLCRHSLRTGPTEFRKLIYGYYMPHDFKSEHIKFYTDHNEGVIDYFEKNDPHKLLVIDLEDGDNWIKLCDFLKKEIPVSDFPFLNRSKNRDHQTGTFISNPYAVRLINAGRSIKKLFTSN